MPGRVPVGVRLVPGLRGDVMRVIVTGSRSWDRKDVVWAALDILAAEAAKVGEHELVVAHGACWPHRDDETGLLPESSADYLADLWIRRSDHPLPVLRVAMPAKWREHRRAAGHLRNKAVGAAGGGLVAAFHRDHPSGHRGRLYPAGRAGLTVQGNELAHPPAPGEGAP